MKRGLKSALASKIQRIPPLEIFFPLLLQTDSWRLCDIGERNVPDSAINASFTFIIFWLDYCRNLQLSSSSFGNLPMKGARFGPRFYNFRTKLSISFDLNFFFFRLVKFRTIFVTCDSLLKTKNLQNSKAAWVQRNFVRRRFWGVGHSEEILSESSSCSVIGAGGIGFRLQLL